jgi:hypothetical protein
VWSYLAREEIIALSEAAFISLLRPMEVGTEVIVNLPRKATDG